MRKWLRDPLPEIPEIPEIPLTPPPDPVSGVSGISGSQLRDGNADRDERAAISEHDGRVPRRWAEGLARLDPNRPPHGFTPARWLEVVNDSGLLLDRWGATLEALGWSDADVWACDSAAPDKRLDLAGLALAMSGREVLYVTSETATIRTTSGTLTFYRHPEKESRVLLWELPAHDVRSRNSER